MWIIVHEDTGNVAKLLDCLSHWGGGWARELKVEEFSAQEGSIRVMEDYDLDIFTRMRGKSIEAYCIGSCNSTRLPARKTLTGTLVPTIFRESMAINSPSLMWFARPSTLTMMSFSLNPAFLPAA